MHEAAYKYVFGITRQRGPVKRVCEFGSYNVNGSVRPLFADADHYVGIDRRAGPGVDIVADCSQPLQVGGLGGLFDMVVSTEMLEHTPSVQSVCLSAASLLRPGGAFVITCAGIGRAAHSCDGGPLPPGEYYRNVTESSLRTWLEKAGFGFILIDTHTPRRAIYTLWRSKLSLKSQSEPTGDRHSMHGIIEQVAGLLCPYCGDQGYWRTGLYYEHQRRCRNAHCYHTWTPGEKAYIPFDAPVLLEWRARQAAFVQKSDQETRYVYSFVPCIKQGYGRCKEFVETFDALARRIERVCTPTEFHRVRSCLEADGIAPRDIQRTAYAPTEHVG